MVNVVSSPTFVSPKIESQPDVILQLIFSFSTAREMGNFIAGSCKDLRHRIQKNDKIWEPIAKRLWGFNEKPHKFSWRDCVIIHQQWKKGIYQERVKEAIDINNPKIIYHNDNLPFLANESEILQYKLKEGEIEDATIKERPKDLGYDYFIAFADQEYVIYRREVSLFYDEEIQAYKEYSRSAYVYAIVDKNNKINHYISDSDILLEKDLRYFKNDKLVFQITDQVLIFDINSKTSFRIDGQLLNYKDNRLYIVEYGLRRKITVYDLIENNIIEEYEVMELSFAKYSELYFNDKSVFLILAAINFYCFELSKGEFVKKWEAEIPFGEAKHKLIHDKLYPIKHKNYLNYYSLYNQINGKKIGECKIVSHKDLKDSLMFDFHQVTYIFNNNICTRDYSPLNKFPKNRYERILLILDKKAHRFLGHRLYNLARRIAKFFKPYKIWFMALALVGVLRTAVYFLE